MRFLNLLICSLVAFLPLESHSLVSRHRYGKGDYTEYLSSFFQPFNEIYDRLDLTGGIRHLIGSFLKSDFDDRDDFNPISFTESLNEGGPGSRPGGDDKMPSQNSIAECLLSEEGDSPELAQKFYMPLRDAASFAKNFERNLEKLVNGDRPFKVLNVGADDSDSDGAAGHVKLKIKCSAVPADSITESCKACLYFEEVVAKRHFRFGHLVDCGVLECMNGYDSKLAGGPTKGYFFNDFPKFHPICIT